MESEIWHLTDDFTKLPAKDILNNILRDDKKNYDRAEAELGGDLELLDEAIVLYIESLQAAYLMTDKWRGNNSNRAAIAMLVSTLNYILIVRHGVLLGYYPEVRDLLRCCYERITRSFLFFHKKIFADRFLSGEEIKPLEVDKGLSELENEPEQREHFFVSLRQYYGTISKVAHPNLKSFEARYGDKELGERVGLEYLVGGIISAKQGHITIVAIIQTVLMALKILGVILPEESGSWDRKYQQIIKTSEGMVNALE